MTLMKRRLRISLNLLLAALAAGLWPGGLIRAQNMINANPAETEDFRSAFVNPAMLSFQDAYVAAGGKLFHLGFVEGQSTPFRQGLVSLALPKAIARHAGLGIQAQYFNSPLYSQTNVSLGFTRRLERIYAFGLKLNIFSRAYNADNFDLVDPNDPVFAGGTSLWTATLGAGAAMIPHPNLALGVGVDHLNQANISLNGDDVSQPLRAHVGAFVNFGFLQASLSVAYEDGYYFPQMTVGTSDRRLGYLRVGYTDRSARFEGQLRVSGPLSLNYSYEYTLFDAQSLGHGSHQVTLIHAFGHQRDLPKFEPPDELILEFQPPPRRTGLEPQFDVYATPEKLQIIEKRLRRVIHPEVKPEALAQLSRFDVGILDSSGTEPFLPFKKDTVDLASIPAALEANLSEDYQAFLEEISNRLGQDVHKGTNIVTGREALLRAAGLKQHLRSDTTGARVVIVQPKFTSPTDSLLAAQKVGPRPLKPEESLTLLSQASTTFKLEPVFGAERVRRWRLIIEDEHGAEVQRFEGQGTPPQELPWDWRDGAGQLLEPGVYYYYLVWQDALQNRYTSNKRPLYVQKLLRTITIEVTHKPKKIGADVDEIDIILKK